MNIKPPKWLVNWLKKRADARPMMTLVGEDHSTYMLRGWVFKPGELPFGLSVRVHTTVRSDEDYEMHDHPWWNISWILQGPGYFETMPYTEGRSPPHAVITSTPTFEKYGEYRIRVLRSQGDIVFRRATDRHRLELIRFGTATAFEVPRPAKELEIGHAVTTLFIMGPYQQRWGFYRGETKIPYRRFLSQKRFNARGCGAVQFGDRMGCARCGLEWDTNDPFPPDCAKKGAGDANQAG